MTETIAPAESQAAESPRIPRPHTDAAALRAIEEATAHVRERALKIRENPEEHKPKLVLSQHVRGTSILDRIADAVNKFCGSMYVFIGITIGIVAWLFLGNVVGFDKTPWPLLLTILNLPQLSIMISLQVSANRAQAASDRRAIADHETLIALHEMAKQQLDILNGQDRVLAILDNFASKDMPGRQRHIQDCVDQILAKVDSKPAAAEGLMDRSRLEAFSDGVFAVAITLLALDLTVAGPAGHGPLTDQLHEKWPAFLAYLISFFMIGIIWVNHHALVRSITKVDRTLLFLNLVLLLFVVLIPFATATVADYFSRQRLGHAGRDDALRRGLPRHVGRLRRDLRVDAARPARGPAAAARAALAGPGAVRRRRAGLRGRHRDRAVQRRRLVRADRRWSPCTTSSSAPPPPPARTTRPTTSSPCPESQPEINSCH